MSSVLITGANRGLGLEFARQYAAGGWRVMATCRNPADASSLQAIADHSSGQVTVHRLEVADHGQIEELARNLGSEPIDLLLNNAGIYGAKQAVLGQIDYPEWAAVLAVNTMAPVRMTECFLESVAQSDKKIIAFISSEMGSIARTEDGRHYPYRSSKAALNMVVKSLAVDLRDRSITAVAISPGWVKTDMGGAEANLTPEESIKGMIRVLSRLRLEDSGMFLSYNGSKIPW